MAVDPKENREIAEALSGQSMQSGKWTQRVGSDGKLEYVNDDGERMGYAGTAAASVVSNEIQQMLSGGAPLYAKNMPLGGDMVEKHGQPIGANTGPGLMAAGDNLIANALVNTIGGVMIETMALIGADIRPQAKIDAKQEQAKLDEAQKAQNDALALKHWEEYDSPQAQARDAAAYKANEQADNGIILGLGAAALGVAGFALTEQGLSAAGQPATTSLANTDGTPDSSTDLLTGGPLQAILAGATSLGALTGGNAPVPGTLEARLLQIVGINNPATQPTPDGQQPSPYSAPDMSMSPGFG